VDSKNCLTIFVDGDNIHVINFGEGGKITKRTLLLILLILLAAAEPAPAAARLVSGKHVPNEIIVKFRPDVAASIEKRLEESGSASNPELTNSLDELNKIYRIRSIQPLFKNFNQKREKTKALLQKDKTLLTKIEKRILARLKRAPKNSRVPELDRIYKLQIKLEKGHSLQGALTAYNSNPDVEYAELNYIHSVNLTPADVLYPLQWSLNNTGQIYPESGNYNTPPGTPDCDIDAPEAWDIYTGSQDIIIAVVDTGVDYRHRDLDNNMWVNSEEIAGNDADDDNNGYVDDIHGYDFINNDSDPCDDRGHGTHCAGTIAAEGNNGQKSDIVGVCWNARIMALKFLGSDGYGSTSDAVIAFYYAVQNGADVISNSWGGGAYSYTLEQAIDYAHSQGVIMVASAGNNNSTSSQYPAHYEHMISVAATNSNDEKAPFSNYGDWVDMAAPGVDILSLRATGTSHGTVYDDYTTVLSGTSMACPHVAGACALLLSTNPQLTCDDVNNILMGTVDPIAPEICKTGRLNLFNAMLAVVSSKGSIILDNDYYSCAGVVGIFLADIDLRGNTTQQVTLTTSGGDSETVLLAKTPPNVGIFTGTIPTGSGDPNAEDGTLQLSHGEIITATYEDTNDGTGNPSTAEDTALADCVPPVISNVLVERTGAFGARITFETDEPTTGQIRCDLTCGGPYTFVSKDTDLGMFHVIRISGLSPETSYYFIVEAADAAENQTTDDNDGACYSFTTSEPGVVYVPSEFPTIQAAIDDVWDGDTVVVADGIHTGLGNRDIDFLGKAITVSSENGPENCIIDCNGTEAELHRGFYFYSGEDANSVVKGFTIINGYAPDDEGGAIKCTDSSPTFDNCIFRGNLAQSSGAGMYNDHSNPILTNCTFSENLVTGDMYSPGGGMSNRYSNPILIDCNFIKNSGRSYHDTFGGGIYNYQSNPVLTNCTFTENSGSIGGGVYNSESNPILIDCTFNRNSVHEGGGAIRNSHSSTLLTNCTFNGNFSDWYGGGGIDNGSNLILTNCTFRGNWTEGRGGGMQNGYNCSVEMTNCIFSGNSAYEGGGIHNSDGNSILMNCTFSGNVATDSNGGAIYNSNRANSVLNNCTFADNAALNGNALACDSYNQSYPSNLQVTNCIFRDGGDEIWNNDGSTIIINYSNVQGGWPGPGDNNINIDPDFVDESNPDPNLRDYHLRPGSPCIDAGVNNSVPPDTTDLDGDGNTTEATPWDLDGHPRFADGDCNSTETVDMGAYEFAYANIGDFDGQCDIDMVDFAIFALAWSTEEGDLGWNPDCDISIPADNSIDMLDLAVFVKHWMAGK
jgi:subtilisin family serine protease